MDHTWTLFLDRDGVINEEKHGGYINTWQEFVFYEGAAQAVADLSNLFLHTIIVTNQKGVGKGLTQLPDLAQIHQNMTDDVVLKGGHIDGIYFCPSLDLNHTHRKPNSGMAYDAKIDFPNIHFEKSIMIGNNGSDMQFGKNVGMTTILLTTTVLLDTVDANLYDYHFPTLVAAAEFIKGSVKK